MIIEETEKNEKYTPEIYINDNDSIKVDSPLLTTGNKERKLHKKIKKDSCVDFKMGKENILTGKPESIGPLNSSTKKNSFVASTQSPMPKAKQSKFRQN